MIPPKLRVVALSASVCCGFFAIAARADLNNVGEQLGTFVSDGSIALDLRYRYEFVDEDGFDESAKASLLRTRLILKSGKVGRVSAYLEIDDIRSMGVEDYNSTENGKTQYPTIADPEGTEVNEAWFRYSTEDLDATLGRQRILLDGGRFVGIKPWRQNEQTYDAARLQWKAASGLVVDASYVTQVNRVFGPVDGSNPADWNGDSTFLRMSYPLGIGHELAGFAYLLDVQGQSDFNAAKTVNNSSNTFGIAYSGAFSGVDVLARLATQEPARDSELSYRAPYYLVELAALLAGMRLKAAYEVLAADNGVGFATPLANGHKHQGWADKFLSTPGDGVKDAWVSLEGNLGPLALTARYHDFSAESSSVSFGTEIDLQAQWVINDWLIATAKAAVFETDAPGRYPDTTKAWLILRIRL
ncbi:alginate export family protein [Congregibacter sp.]|nr:alginate export family protein [Congregibacter sp.]MDA8962297.1 alginate export family protein [Congregibacter sp.]